VLVVLFNGWVEYLKVGLHDLLLKRLDIRAVLRIVLLIGLLHGGVLTLHLVEEGSARVLVGDRLLELLQGALQLLLLRVKGLL